MSMSIVPIVSCVNRGISEVHRMCRMSQMEVFGYHLGSDRMHKGSSLEIGLSNPTLRCRPIAQVSVHGTTILHTSLFGDEIQCWFDDWFPVGLDRQSDPIEKNLAIARLIETIQLSHVLHFVGGQWRLVLSRLCLYNKKESCHLPEQTHQLDLL